MPVAVSGDGRDGMEVRPLPGTDGARYPFWSPDSRSIGFFTVIDVRKVDVAGGTARKIAGVPSGTGGIWNRDGTILIGTLSRGLFRVAATGAFDPVAPSGAGDELLGQYPVFLPDGRHFLYWGIGGQVQNAIYIGSLDSNERQLLVAADRGDPERLPAQPFSSPNRSRPTATAMAPPHFRPLTTASWSPEAIQPRAPLKVAAGSL